MINVGFLLKPQRLFLRNLLEPTLTGNDYAGNTVLRSGNQLQKN